MPLQHGHNLRKGRVSIPHQSYLITTVTQKRQPLFTNFYNARIVIKSINYTEQICDIKSMCFVVMPDHMHWLLSLGNNSSLSQVVANVKRRSGYRINQHNKRTGIPVWQSGFHDYALRKEEDIKSVARYIVANPLRAGLVKNIGDYPFWDAVWL
jgi:putative transposase